MHRTNEVSIVFLICLQLFAVSCSKPAGSLPEELAAACPSPSPVIANDGKLKLFIPDDEGYGWVKYILDETTKQAAKAGLSDLKTVAHTGNDLEIRFWLGSIDGLRGIIFQRISGRWAATQLEYLDYRGILNPTQPYPEPDIGWDAFWGKLVSDGILELPDGRCFKDYHAVMDGVGFTIELNLQGAYRIYHYSNPQAQTADHGVKDPQAIEAARRMSEIAGQIIEMSLPRKQ